MKTKTLGILSAATACLLVVFFLIKRLPNDDRPRFISFQNSTVALSRHEGAIKPSDYSQGGSEEKNYRHEYLKSYAYRKFAPLLIKLSAKLPPAVVDSLRQTLAEREIIFAEAKAEALKLRTDPQVYLSNQSELIRTRLTSKFGDQTARDVENYIKTLPFRKSLNEINLIMIYRGDGMSSAVMEKLCDLISEIDTSPRPRVPTPSAIDAYVRTMESNYEKLQMAAAGILSPNQLEVLRDELRMEISNMKSQRGEILATAARNY